jgi:hypothetical protein
MILRFEFFQKMPGRHGGIISGWEHLGHDIESGPVVVQKEFLQRCLAQIENS